MKFYGFTRPSIKIENSLSFYEYLLKQISLGFDH